MKKIKLLHILPEAFEHTGFDQRGCYGCDCNDACCRYGADVDRESYDLIKAHSDEIEKLIGRSVDECFEREWADDSEYLGGNAIRSRVGYNGYCRFHMPEGKGCSLYKLAIEKNLPRRIVPSICRLYPLTWDYGTMRVSDHIEPACNTLAADNHTRDNLVLTQRKEIADIFEIHTSAVPEELTAPVFEQAPLS